jgi:hypothetical protein
VQDADVRNEKVAMEDRLTLRATAPWLSVPSALMLASNGRNFEIQVGPAAECWLTAGVGRL